MLKNVWGERRPTLIRWIDETLDDILRAAGGIALAVKEAIPGDQQKAPPVQPPVVLVHGYGVDVGSLTFIARVLKGDDFRVYTVELDTPRHRVEELAAHLKERVDQIREGTGFERVDLLGHSLGGVISRYYVQMLDGHDAVRRVITLGSPHRDGTYATYLVFPLRRLGIYPFPNGQSSATQLLPGSEFYRRLNGPEYRVENLRFVDFHSLWGLLDEFIVPSWNSVAPNAQNHLLFPEGHLGIIMSPRVYREIKRILLH